MLNWKKWGWSFLYYLTIPLSVGLASLHKWAGKKAGIITINKIKNRR